MTKSPFLKKHQPKLSVTKENRRKQKFAIWDYYKKKNGTSKQAGRDIKWKD